MIVLKKNNQVINLNSKTLLQQVVKAEFRQSLLSEDIVSISVESKKPISFNLGDKIEHNNRFYHLNFAPKVKREQGTYTYDLTFEGSQYLLRQKVYFNLDKENFQTTADFSLTGEIEIFLRVLITNINSLNQENWILGDFPQDTEIKTLSFNGENCLAVLQKICQEYDTEFEIIQNQNNYTLNIKKIGKTLPYVFQYGKGNGLYSLSRENINNDVVTRLYAFGSTENIPSDYRNYSDRLRMPDEDYIQDNAKVALFGLKEGVKNFDDIKPTFKGIISEVKPFNTQTKTQEIVVSNMDFDLNERDSNGTKWLINDTPAKLHFNKGNLAGYSFELSKNNGYNHATKTFKIKQWTDERGQAFPDPNTNAFIFNVGDEFTLLDIVMPPVYITNAENKLLEEAQKEYEKQSKNNAKYSLDIDPLFLAQSNTNTPFEIGDYLRVIDSDLNIDKTSRIIGISQDLNEPFKYQLDIADDYEINFTLSVLNDIKDTKTIIKTQEQVNRQQHLNSIRNLAELRESVFDTEGYFDPQNIKPQSIETNMLSVGAKNQQFALENVTLNPNVSGNPMYLSITGGKLVHFSLEANIREWNIAALNMNNLANTTYYVYAKVLRGGNTGTWLVTTEKIRFDERSDYYHFLCYLLYTPKDGKREAEAMYGSVTMHGGQINAGRIKSNNGKAYFDLDTGEISGKINFTNDSPALQQVSDSIQVGGRNLMLNSKKVFNGHHFPIYTTTPLEVGADYTFSVDVLGDVSGEIFFNNSLFLRYNKGGNPNEWRRISVSFKFIKRDYQNREIYPHIYGATSLRNPKLEKGNKATDWTPAPEDLEAEILSSKTESINASKAYADAQDALRKVEANAYADGKVTAAEQRAILDATNKADSAKNYATAQDALLRTQLEAYADGVVDAEEQARIAQAQTNLNAAKAYADAQDNLAKIAANAYADGIVDAEEQRAIADATAKMEAAKAHAQVLMNSIQVGGRNLVLNTKEIKSISRWETFPEDYIFYNIAGERLEPNTEYVVTWEYKTEGSVKPMMAFFVSEGGEHRYIGGIQQSNEWQKMVWKFQTGSNPNQKGIIRFDHKGTTNGQNSTLFTRLVKLEKGNKATDWTPAPEDVEAQITTAQNTANQALGLTQAQTANVTALQQKTNFLSSTAISGNAVATGTLIVGNGLGANAGITGLGGDNDIFLWGGADYQGRNNAPISMHRDGFLRVRNAQGRVIFEIGQQNGDAVFNIYNNDGVKVAGIGQRGIEFTGYIPENFDEKKLLRLDLVNFNDNQSLISAINTIYGTQMNGFEGINGETYYRISFTTNATGYNYNAGRNFESAGNLQYEQYFFASKNKFGDKVANGIYALESFTIASNEANGGMYDLSVTIYDVQEGKIVRSKVVNKTGYVNSIIID
ncbi:hypothetical protein ACFFUE_07315 [Bergeyella porcorum]|uniref:hypothetical protein n=1 Tax=Bergeyella porcorum TaxID=1735111 RepID=UPI0035E68D17